MGLPVITVASGGLPVVDTGASLRGTPVTEAPNGIGMRVTKVAAYGLPVAYETIGVVAPVVMAVWDGATASAVTLSGGNLVATNTGTTTDHGAHVAAASGKTSGKYYFEVTLTTFTTIGGDSGVGIGTPASTYAGMGGGSGVVGDLMYLSTGNIYTNGSSAGASLGVGVLGVVYGMAVDVDNRKIWFRKAPVGNWNNSGTANPATNVGGITIPAGTMVPFLTFGGAVQAAGNVLTANFGPSGFSGAAPAGFTAGWPA
jgi:hypothetical protein